MRLYTRSTKSWPNLYPNDRGELDSFCLTDDEAAHAEVVIDVVTIGGYAPEGALKVTVFDDGFGAFVNLADVFVALGTENPRTADELEAVLLSRRFTYDPEYPPKSEE